MVPLNQIQLGDIDDDLEGNDDDLEVKIEDEVALFDSILFCNNCFLVKHPE